MDRDAKHNLEAIALVCCAYAGFSFADAFVKYLTSFYPVHIILIISSFAGMLVVTGPVYTAMSTGIFYALGAMVCISLNILLLRKMERRDYLPIYSFYPFTFIFLSNLPMALYEFEWPSRDHLMLFAPYIALLICAQICNGLGYRHARMTAVIAPFHYTQMVWGIILGYLVFGDVPLVTTLIGAGMIISAGLFVIWQQYRHARATRAVPVRS